MQDLIIIGAGPAGLTSAVYAARKRMDFLIIAKDLGGEAMLSGDVENYLGYHHISGKELVERFEEHVKDYNIDLKEGETVSSIEKNKGGFKVKTDNGEYEAKTVIIASGKKPRVLNVSGEKEFKNKGVTYCATCDAPLFSGKNVAVIGGGNAALDAVLQLTKIAKKIYLIVRGSKLKADKILVDNAMQSGIVEIIKNADTKEIHGKALVNGMTIEREGKKEKLAVEGIFIEIGSIPNVDFDNITEKNEWNEIKIDKKCATSVQGIFAAGDVSDVPEKQIIIAAGQGALATLEAFSFINKQ
ncbi:MAG: FAD-dependent oxidoreductase [bacterium]|nr:FAD-dependent oxidoreductase [bacterium]